MLAVHQYVEQPGKGTRVQLIQHKTVSAGSPVERADGGRDWSELTDKEVMEEMETSPDWRSYEDNAFESYRSLGKVFDWLSSVALGSPHITRKRIMLLLFAISATGGMWLFLILAEVIGSSGLKPNYMTFISQLSPLSVDTGAAIVSIFPAVGLLFAPLAYLQFETDYTCQCCRQPFALASEGRYYRPNLDIQQTRSGRKVNGFRILRCEKCGELVKKEADWSLRD
ncbi:hypothetical protein ACFO0N_14940 [Halobium salinum]|uniref:Uncharacterized protein n=1 Tax=Halobium salinum TaxID=1364940 RepID=A0ABD5PEB8_9EURY|nr:hypothetical protein [Halobium salinum]